MASTFLDNRSTYMTLASASRAKAKTQLDEALSNDEKNALCDAAHELRTRYGWDALSFLIQAAYRPYNAESFWHQAAQVSPYPPVPSLG